MAETQLIRADKVIVGDRIGIFGWKVTKVITSDNITSIITESEFGPGIAEDRSDRLISIRVRK